LDARGRYNKPVEFIETTDSPGVGSGALNEVVQKHPGAQVAHSTNDVLDDLELTNNSNLARIEVSLLGGFRLERGSALLAIPPSAERLIAFLVFRGTRIRAEIAGTLWPNVPEKRALASLRSTLWRIQGICPEVFTTGRTTIRLASDVGVDVRHFVDNAAQIVQGRLPPSRANAAAELLSRDLLPGWYDDWVITERERLRQLGLNALETLAGQLAQRGNHADALQAALSAVAAEPLRESAHRLAVEVHLAQGHVAEAVHQYQACRRALLDELGISPNPEFAELVRSAAMHVHPTQQGLVARQRRDPLDQRWRSSEVSRMVNERVEARLTRVGGVAGMRLQASLDTAQLAPADAAELRRLAEVALDTPTARPVLRQPRPDEFVYHLTLTLPNIRRQMSFNDDTLPESLHPLINWLLRQARGRRSEGTT